MVELPTRHRWWKPFRQDEQDGQDEKPEAHTAAADVARAFKHADKGLGSGSYLDRINRMDRMKMGGQECPRSGETFLPLRPEARTT